MPIYEYQCRGCGKRTSRLVLSISTPPQQSCAHCHSPDMERLMSRFASPKSEAARLEALADPSQLSGVDENDPQSMARFMKKNGAGNGRRHRRRSGVSDGGRAAGGRRYGGYRLRLTYTVMNIHLTDICVSPTITKEMDTRLDPMGPSILPSIRHDDRPQERTPHGDGDVPLSQGQPPDSLPLHSGSSATWLQARQGMAVRTNGSRTVASRAAQFHPAALKGNCR